MKRALLLTFAYAALAGAGLLHGALTGRWHRAEDLQPAVDRMAGLPLRADAWQGREVEEVSALLPEVFGPTKVFEYRNQETGEAVTVAVCCGKTGPFLHQKHSPMECYPSNGYRVERAPRHVAVPVGDGAAAADFEVATFRKDADAGSHSLRVYWAWSGDGAWKSPSSPRLEFARHPVLYKLYAIREVSAPDEPADNDPAKDLLRCLLPAAEAPLFRHGP